MSTWKCDVCGYVHQGELSPDSCSICGADSEHFSPMRVNRQPTPPITGNRWQCSICDHIDSGPQPPERCTICGAAAHLFEPINDELQSCSDKSIDEILILGGGIAGITAAEEARKCSTTVKIRIISKEPGLPYYRLNLTRYLAGEVSEKDLTLQSLEWFAERKIELTEGEALKIDRANKQVKLRDGRIFNFDKLILANGSHPFVPPLPGATRDGIFTLRTISDAQQILERLQPGVQTVCIGGGLLGLETAGALARRGAKVTIIEGHPWLMPRQLPQQAAELLKKHLQKLGIEVICGAQVQELAGDEHLHSVLLADGREITAELAIISAGVRPNSCLGRQAALKVKTGLLVNDQMVTSDPDIYAAGDSVEHRGRLYGIWPASYAQGAAAGINAAGGNSDFSGLSLSTRVKVLDVDLFSTGQMNLADASYRLLEKSADGNYYGLVCRDNHLTGAALFGDTQLAGVLKEAIEKEIQLPELPEIQQLFPSLLG